MNKCIMCDRKAVARGVCLNHWKQLYQHPLYRTWDAMKQRCNNQNNKRYYLYGAKGIKVCERWLIFKNFLADMGERPTPQHSIDRIDETRGYEPSNCRWATSAEQNIHLRVSNKSKSGERGVSWDATRNKWCVRLKVDGKQKHIGYFENVKEAIKVAIKVKNDRAISISD